MRLWDAVTSATSSPVTTPSTPMTLTYPTTSDKSVRHLMNGVLAPCSSLFYYFRTAIDSLFTDWQHTTRKLVDSSVQIKLTASSLFRDSKEPTCSTECKIIDHGSNYCLRNRPLWFAWENKQMTWHGLYDIHRCKLFHGSFFTKLGKCLRGPSTPPASSSTSTLYPLIQKSSALYHDPPHANQPLQCQLWYPVFVVIVSFAFSASTPFFSIFF